ncbi:MAG: hypothetical protein JWN44_5075 [Myxococcales bacterium]|nr:hypothetical protein [Myxococcales bacterium]
MRSVAMVMVATLGIGGAGAMLGACDAHAPVTPMHVGPCEVQAIDATAAPCASDPRLAALGGVFARAPLSGFGCIKPAAAPPSRSVEVLGRGGDRTRLRLRTSRSTSTLALRDGSTVVVGDAGAGGALHALALTCHHPR